jgi:hypothetical protein
VSDPIDRLRMPASAVADLARAVPDDLVKAIVGDITDARPRRRPLRKV